ncbi:putative circularly permuted 1,3-beta-glucanase [Sphaerulina musiva]
MRYSFSAAALFAATVSADLCSYGSTDDNGNWYCKQVNAITYTGVGGSASYNKVTAMDSKSGSCSSSPYGYSGSMSPLDEEVSLHFRGPLQLKQLAVYTPGSSGSSHKAKRSAHRRRHAGGAHGHGHVHEEKREAGLGDMVNAIIDGKSVSWANTYDGTASSNSPPAAAAYAPPSSSPPKAASYGQSSSSSSSSSGAAANTKPSSSSGGSSSGSGWNRVGYYNSQAKTSDGLVFLNHEGGSGSGVFDYTFGNSLSYASADGCSGASAPQVLADTTIPSNNEVVVMTDNKCTDSSCGYVRDGTVAYHGWDGPSKAFFFEFSMPDDGKTGQSIYDPVNMPAIWMLNAQIPRTLQYGNADCSCWKSGCGEFDIFEVLAAGDTRCKSTLHGNIAGGNSDYFARPTNGTIKAALLLYSDNIHIKILDNSVTFGTTMDNTFVKEIIADTMEESLSNLVSIFKLSS